VERQRDLDAVRCVLIDPAAHGGHRESDLAMLALFGLPHLDR
jgi:fructosamine-3-kinase